MEMKMVKQDTKMKELQDFSPSAQQECFLRDKRTIRDVMQMRQCSGWGLSTATVEKRKFQAGKYILACSLVGVSCSVMHRRWDVSNSKTNLHKRKRHLSYQENWTQRKENHYLRVAVCFILLGFCALCWFFFSLPPSHSIGRKPFLKINKQVLYILQNFVPTGHGWSEQ